MDYTAYTEKNIQQFNGKIKNLPKLATPRVASNLLFVLIWFAFVTPLYSVGWILLGVLNPVLIVIGIILYVPLLIIFRKFMRWSTNTGNDYTLRMALFAERNGFQYRLEGGRYDIDGAISSVLGKPLTSNIVKGTTPEGIQFTLCTTAGKGFYILLTVTLPNVYPHILLDSRSNDFGVSNLLSYFPNSKEIALEGNFSQYFRVFSTGSSVETLQVLSPELMVRMLDYPRRADIEIVGDRLQFVLNYKRLTDTDIRALFEATTQILKDIGANSNNATVAFASGPRLKP